MELETDLRVASDRVLKTIEQLEALENEKRTVTPGSPRFKTLATEVERLAATVFAQTHAQSQLGDRAQAATERTGVTLPAIEDSEQARDVQQILSEWRDAERRLIAAEPDSAEHAQATADVGRLRDEYHRSYTQGQTGPTD